MRASSAAYPDTEQLIAIWLRQVSYTPLPRVPVAEPIPVHRRERVQAAKAKRAAKEDVAQANLVAKATDEMGRQ